MYQVLVYPERQRGAKKKKKTYLCLLGLQNAMVGDTLLNPLTSVILESLHQMLLAREAGAVGDACFGIGLSLSRRAIGAHIMAGREVCEGTLDRQNRSGACLKNICGCE